GSIPVVSIDLPGANSIVSASGIYVAGWAVDLSSTSGPGVDTLHAWAFPVDAPGGTVRFAGVANYGGARADIASIFGSQFLHSGYDLTITNLTPGTWDIGLYLHSAVSGSFNAVRTVRVIVQ